jgi:hypothetical protein
MAECVRKRPLLLAIILIMTLIDKESVEGLKNYMLRAVPDTEFLFLSMLNTRSRTFDFLQEHLVSARFINMLRCSSGAPGLFCTWDDGDWFQDFQSTRRSGDCQGSHRDMRHVIYGDQDWSQSGKLEIYRHYPIQQENIRCECRW